LPGLVAAVQVAVGDFASPRQTPATRRQAPDRRPA